MAFDPRQQGIVRGFHITRVTPEEQIGGAVSKSVTASASVQLPTGNAAEETLVITMTRGVDGPWMVTGITAAAAAPGSPPR